MPARSIDTLYEQRLTRRNEVLDRYLSVLDNEERSIGSHRAARLNDVLLFERDLLTELQSLAGVIRTLGGRLAPAAPGSVRERLERSGATLLSQVRRRHAAVRSRLAEQIAETGRRIDAAAVPKRGRSIFRSQRDSGSMVDLSL